MSEKAVPQVFIVVTALRKISKPFPLSIDPADGQFQPGPMPLWVQSKECQLEILHIIAYGAIGRSDIIESMPRRRENQESSSFSMLELYIVYYILAASLQVQPHRLSRQ